MTRNGLYEELIIAGFGGQGIMLSGKLLAQTAMKADKQVTFMPSYGAEVRGGTANCMVVISNSPIASPLVSNPNSLIAMNKASLNKFGSRLKKNGLLILNSSLIDNIPQLDPSIEILEVPANDIAVQLGNVKCANMVAIGAYLQKKGLLTHSQAADSLPQTIAKRYHNTLSLNTQALKQGADFAKNHNN